VNGSNCECLKHSFTNEIYFDESIPIAGLFIFSKGDVGGEEDKPAHPQMVLCQVFLDVWDKKIVQKKNRSNDDQILFLAIVTFLYKCNDTVRHKPISFRNLPYQMLSNINDTQTTVNWREGSMIFWWHCYRLFNENI
jgi:hypothetical protein